MKEKISIAKIEMRSPSLISPTILCAMIGLIGLIMSIMAIHPNNQTVLAAVFPVWWTAPHSFAAAGSAGDVAAVGAFSFVLIVRSQNPGLAARLRAAGAFLLLDPPGAVGCAFPAK